MDPQPPKQPKKKLKIRRTRKLETAMRLMLANVGNRPESEILREAGYAESIARNPQKVTGTKFFIDALEQAGVTDDYLAKEFLKLSSLERLEMVHFPARRSIQIGKHDKKKRKVTQVYNYIPCSDEEIIGTITNISGAKLISITKGDLAGERVAYVALPDSIVRKGILDLGFKVKGHYAADKAFTDLANHIINPKEEEEINTILKSNKK